MSEAPLILIADDSLVSREYLSNILLSAGYQVIQAVDGGSAFRVVKEHNVALAIIDHYMEPYGGLEFAKGLKIADINIPMIMVTNEETSDLLVEVTRHGMAGFLRKPADEKHLKEMIRRALRRKEDPKPVDESGIIGADVTKTFFSHEELMKKAVDLAVRNVNMGHGGPFGAIIADKDGKIVGEGTNGLTSRADPAAHAEVMAIRQATLKLNTLSLEGCSLYTSSEPTKIGKALIESVGLSKVYFGLSHSQVNEINPPKIYTHQVEYEQFKQKETLEELLQQIKK